MTYDYMAEVKGHPCAVCGHTPTDAANAAGERVCAQHAAADQGTGLDVAWDEDAPQEYMMYGPRRSRPAGPPAPSGLEPGWSRDDPLSGPCYKRHVPGKGIARVICRGPGNFAWYLSTTSRSVALSWPRDGFADPGAAMADADRKVACLRERMFERLTPGEARELYRRLSRACDWGQELGDRTLADVMSELFTHIQIQATDPAYDGPDPYQFIWAVRDASYGAAVQAMSASPNRLAWLHAPRHRRAPLPAADQPSHPQPPDARRRGPAAEPEGP